MELRDYAKIKGDASAGVLARVEDKLDDLLELLSQEVVTVRSGKKFKTTRRIESTRATAARAQVGRSATSRGWTFKEWESRFGLRVYGSLTQAEQSVVDARR